VAKLRRDDSAANTEIVAVHLIAVDRQEWRIAKISLSGVAKAFDGETGSRKREGAERQRHAIERAPPRDGRHADGRHADSRYGRPAFFYSREAVKARPT